MDHYIGLHPAYGRDNSSIVTRARPDGLLFLAVMPDDPDEAIAIVEVPVCALALIALIAMRWRA